MIRLSGVLPLLLAISVSVGGQQQVPPRAPQALRTEVALIQVDVNVVDGKGLPVGDLRQDEFTVTVDGKPRPVASSQFVLLKRAPAPQAQAAPRRYFSSNQGPGQTPTSPTGRLFLIVVDSENIGIGGSRAVMAAASRFLDRLTPADRVGLATIPRGGPNAEFTSDLARIRQALGRVVGRSSLFRPAYNIGLSEAFSFVAGNTANWTAVVTRECLKGMMAKSEDAAELQACQSTMEAEAQQMVAESLQRTRDSVVALRALVTALGRLSGPKTLVLVSEGLVVGQEPRYMGDFLSDALPVAEAAARASVTIYVLHLDRSSADYDASAQFSPPTPSEDAMMRRTGLDTIAGAARGTMFNIVGTGDAAFERLERETSGYYLLGIEQTESDQDGKRHKIGVEVTRKGLAVRARREFGPLRAPGAERSVKPEEEVAAMLGSPLAATDLPLRVATYTVRDAQKSKLRVIISADVDQGRTEPAEFTVGLTLRDQQNRVPASAIERKTLGPLDPSRPGPAVYTVAEVVDPGSYTLKLAATDATGRRGSVEHPVVARLASSEGLEVSDLVVADRPRQAGSTWRPAIEAVVQDTLTAYLEVYSADRGRLRQSSVSFEVSADEKSPALLSVSSKLQETKQADRNVAEGSVPLGLLPPGEYLARAVVSFSGRPVTAVFHPVRVARTVSALAAGVNRPAGSLILFIVGSTAVEPFRPELVLEPATVSHFLDRLVKLSATPPSPNVSKAIDEARAGRFDAAVDALKGAGQGDLGATFIRGLALLSRGKPKLAEATDHFRASLKISSAFIPAIVYLGACYAISGHDRDAAGAWQSSLLTENDAEVVYRLLGDALLRLGDGEQARDILLEASLAWPDDEDLKRRLAVAYAITGQEKEALAALDPYLAHHPNDDRALFLAMSLIYLAYAEGRTVEAPADDAQRISRYQQLYAAAKGPQLQLATAWVRFVEQKK
jgi:VWFA-related protein